MVGILLSYWDGLFSGAMLVSGRVVTVSCVIGSFGRHPCDRCVFLILAVCNMYTTCIRGGFVFLPWIAMTLLWCSFRLITARQQSSLFRYSVEGHDVILVILRLGHGHELNCMPNQGVHDGNLKICMNVPMFHYNLWIAQANSVPTQTQEEEEKRQAEERRKSDASQRLFYIAIDSGSAVEGVMVTEAKNESPTKCLAKLWRYHNANMYTSMMFLIHHCHYRCPNPSPLWSTSRSVYNKRTDHGEPVFVWPLPCSRVVSVCFFFVSGRQWGNQWRRDHVSGVS